MAPPLLTILLCGDSLLLAGLETSLRRQPGLHLLHFSANALMAETSPSEAVVAVYDQSQLRLEQLTEWLNDCPALTLLGLDAEHDRVQVWTSRRQAMLAVGDLERLVLQAVENPSPCSKEE